MIAQVRSTRVRPLFRVLPAIVAVVQVVVGAFLVIDIAVHMGVADDSWIGIIIGALCVLFSFFPWHVALKGRWPGKW